MSRIRADQILNGAGTGAPSFPKGIILSGVSTITADITTTGIITAASGSFSGNVSVGGTLTYEDVTSIDSVGVITARSGIHVTGSGVNGRVGIGTDNPDRALHIAQANSTAYSGTDAFDKDYHVLKLNNTTDDGTVGMQFLIGSDGEAAITASEVAGSATDLMFSTRSGGNKTEKLRIEATGNIGIGTNNPGELLHMFSSSSLTLKIHTTGPTSPSTIEFKGPSNGRIDFTPDTSGSASGRIMYVHSDDSMQFSTKASGGNITERLRITSDGYVTKPYQPCFWATSNSGATDSANGYTGIISDNFESTFVNVGNHYNTTTGVFACPVAGVYEFHGQGLARAMSGTGEMELTFYKNGSNVSVRSLGYVYCTVSNDHDNLHIMAYISCAVNDEIDLRIHNMAAGVDCYWGQGLGYFSGRLVG